MNESIPSTRREFLNASAAAAAGLLLASTRSGAEPVPVAAPVTPRRVQPRIPRWRGFNLPPETAKDPRTPEFREAPNRPQLTTRMVQKSSARSPLVRYW